MVSIVRYETEINDNIYDGGRFVIHLIIGYLRKKKAK